MAKEKSREELQRELEFLKTRRLVDGFAALANNAIRWGGAIAIVYFGITRPIEALAGKATLADIAVLVRAQLEKGEGNTWALVGSWLLTVLAVAYGWLQRRLRRNTVEQLQGRIQALEKGVNPTRTSSTLTPRGDTRKEDRI